MKLEILYKLIAIALIFLGETVCVYAEIIATKNNSHVFQNYLFLFIKMALLFGLGGAFLIAGYKLGYVNFKNIWIVIVISTVALLIVEPILAWIFFHEIPTTGAAIGLALGVIGLITTLIF